MPASSLRLEANSLSNITQLAKIKRISTGQPVNKFNNEKYLASYAYKIELFNQQRYTFNSTRR